MAQGESNLLAKIGVARKTFEDAERKKRLGIKDGSVLKGDS